MANNIVDRNNNGIISIDEEFFANPLYSDEILDNNAEKLSLDLSIIHSKYYWVEGLKGSEIGKESTGYFGFSNVAAMPDKTERDSYIGRNVRDFAKFLLAARLTGGSKYTEFSMYPDTHIKGMLNQYVEVLNTMGDGLTAGYINEVFGVGRNVYYHDFLSEKKLDSQSSSMGQTTKANVKVKALPGFEGLREEQNTMVEKQAAFINAVYYPLIVLVISIVFFVLYTCLQFMIK